MNLRHRDLYAGIDYGIPKELDFKEVSDKGTIYFENKTLDFGI